MNKSVLLITVLGLGGCASTSPTYLADGQQGLSIDCSGEAMSWAKCYEQADESCAAKGYTLVGTDGTPAPREADKTLNMDIGNFNSRSIVVKCK
ncbi:hypothetical protein [Pseudomonas sp.]|uniref:hypothetical protein n=1 Tax=Pseudomonas sp. TaxID=306 RepID=UPI002632F691|nr:hypothetical protein [Pseudomonas sp.]